MTITEASKSPSTARMDWATPWPLFRLIDKKFGPFTLDPCATPENAKCERFYTEADDGLSKNWANETVFCNPPYGKATPHWVEKAYAETAAGQCSLAVCLIVPRSDTLWFHAFCSQADEILLLQGRVAFEDPTTGKRNSPQDPSCVVVFRPGIVGPPKLTFWDWKAELSQVTA